MITTIVRTTANVPRVLVSPAVLAAAGLVALAFDVSAQTPPSIAWSNARVSVVATDTPLDVVLRELARRTGSRIIGLEQATERVTVDIRDAHLLDAVRTLLADARVNYLSMLQPRQRGPADRVTVWLYGPSAPGAPKPAGEVVVVAAGEGMPVSPPAQPWAPAVDDDVSRLHRNNAFGAAASEASLLGLARSPSHEVRILALQTLALQSTPIGLEAIRAALKDAHPFVRAEAMDLLISQSPGVAAVARLGALAEHADPEVRGVAAMALGEQSGKEAEFLLERALSDGDGAVRGFAAQALKQQQTMQKPRQ